MDIVEQLKLSLAAAWSTAGPPTPPEYLVEQGEECGEGTCACRNGLKLYRYGLFLGAEIYEVVVNFTAATTSKTGLTLQTEPEIGIYPIGLRKSHREMAELECGGLLNRYEWHPGWNYPPTQYRLHSQ